MLRSSRRTAPDAACVPSLFLPGPPQHDCYCYCYCSCSCYCSRHGHRPHSAAHALRQRIRELRAAGAPPRLPRRRTARHDSCLRSPGRRGSGAAGQRHALPHRPRRGAPPSAAPASPASAASAGCAASGSLPRLRALASAAHAHTGSARPERGPGASARGKRAAHAAHATRGRGVPIACGTQRGKHARAQS